MIHKLFTAAFLFLACSFAEAQCLPPHLDDPAQWDVHDQNGPTAFSMQAELLFADEGVEIFLLVFTGVVNGEAYRSESLAFQEFNEEGNSCEVDVINGDSGNWTQWTWQGDHFEKVGGTQHQRFFYPIY